MTGNLIISLEIVEEELGKTSSIEFAMGFRLLLLKVIADGANMSESGFKVDPFFYQTVKDHNQRLTNSMVAKSAREKRRKVIAEKKAKRRRVYESNVVSPIKEPKVTQIAMRCSTTSNVVLSNNGKKNLSSDSNARGHQQTSRSSGEKLLPENRLTNAEKK